METEEGALIKKSIEDFYAERTEKNLSIVLNVLMGSLIWIPCNTVMGQSDQQQVEELLRQADGDSDALVGKTFTSKDQVRLLPDILQNGEDYYFPVFSSREEMGEYGEHFSKVQKTFMEATVLAKNNENFDVAGIVVNAFTNPFILKWDLLDLIMKPENLKEKGEPLES